MRVTTWTTGIFLTGALMSAAAAPAPKPPAPPTHKVTCLCDCPDDTRARPLRAAPPRRRAPRRAGASYYNYASAAPAGAGDWHGPWRAAPNDMIQPYAAAPPSYPAPSPDYPPADLFGPPPDDMADSDVHIDDRGWTGGVGANAGGGGGGGGGFVDGYGQVHFAQGGGQENGPTYNSYNQSFQANPSVPGAFQPRLMGGLAPPVTSGK